MNNVKLLAIALSVASLTACTPEKVLNSIVAADSGHNLIGYEPDTDESSSASEQSSANPISSSSEYVPPLGEPCEAGEFQHRVWSCVDGHRFYI